MLQIFLFWDCPERFWFRFVWRLKKPVLKIFYVISLTNDTVGYVCPRQAYKEEGYEPGRGTNLTEGIGEIIAKQTLNIINQIKRSP